MKTSETGLDLIKHFESFRSTPYLCPAKKWTIGYGSTIGVTKTTPKITEEQADLLLRTQIERYENSVIRLINVPLNQNQFDALVSFVYNLGGANLQSSTLRMKLNRGEYNTVPKELLKWVFSNGIKLKGLVVRRSAEALLFKK